MMRAFAFAMIATTFAGTAAAQEAPAAPQAAGTVVSLSGPPGSVMVFRGAKAEGLVKDAALFQGDRVFTRANGEVVLSVSGCEQHLGNASSIVVDAKFCKATPISLADKPIRAGAAAGVVIATAETAASASPNLLPILGAVGLGGATLFDVDSGATKQ